jgi:hypothetical protein
MQKVKRDNLRLLSENDKLKKDLDDLQMLYEERKQEIEKLKNK